MHSLLEYTTAQATVSLLAVGVTILWIFHFSYFHRIWDRLVGKVPPGPWAFPLLGTIKVDRQHPEVTFQDWSARYGKLFSFFLGQRFCIGVSDINLIKKLFKDDRFSGRGNAGIFSHFQDDMTKGIAFSNGDLWKEHRSFSLSTLRDFGVGKAGGSENIQKEAEYLITAMKEEKGNEFDPSFMFITAAANALSQPLFGEGFQSDDPHFITFVNNVTTNMKEFASSVILEVYPWLRMVYPFSNKFKRLNMRVREVFKFLEELVQKRKKTFDPSSLRGDYFDEFFAIQQRNQLSLGNEGTFSDEQLTRNLADILITGYETTATFLRWSMLYMMLHPEVQVKVQSEIDAVIGNSRLPTLTDRQQMPFTEAVITEIHRISYFVPFGVPHCATEDVKFEGYTIPKGTEIWPIICHHFMNPEVWGDPQIFRPERFLDADGSLIAALVDQVQPFSVGRRACLGEPLAKAELFSFFSSILQNFTVTSKTKPSTVPLVSQVLSPPPFTMIARARF